MNTNQDRRHFRRFEFDAEAVLIWNAKRIPCDLVDISLKGLLLNIADEWTAGAGELGEVEFRLADQSPIRMQVILAHQRDNHAGFRWESIDFDSFARLKRLVELNLGDPQLLNRELSALG